MPQDRKVATFTTIEPTSNALPAGKLDSVDSMVNGLRQRLEAQPNDMNGWVLLYQSYQHLQRWQDANDAFEKAKSLGYTGEGPTLSRNSLPVSSSQLSNRFSPSSNRLASSSNSNLLTDYFRQSMTENPASKNSSAGPSNTQGLKLRVTLAPSLKNQLPPQTTVFIFARSLNSGGAPLAVLKKNIHDLPLDVVLNDNMAMIPGKNISSAEQLLVGARISLSGNPIKQDGDFEALSSPTSPTYDGILSLIIGDHIEDHQEK